MNGRSKLFSLVALAVCLSAVPGHAGVAGLGAFTASADGFLVEGRAPALGPGCAIAICGLDPTATDWWSVSWQWASASAGGRRGFGNCDMHGSLATGLESDYRCLPGRVTVTGTGSNAPGTYTATFTFVSAPGAPGSDYSAPITLTIHA